MAQVTESLLAVFQRRVDAGEHINSTIHEEEQLIHAFRQYVGMAWLASLRANSIHLCANDGHACNYMTAAKWIEDEMAAEADSEFHDCTPDELQRMAETNTIWSLQIYPRTPNGFHRWVAPTMVEVIAKARADWPEIEAGL